MMYFELINNLSKYKKILNKYNKIKIMDKSHYFYEVSDSFIRKIKLSNLNNSNNYKDLHFIFNKKYVKIYDEKPEIKIKYSDYIAEHLGKNIQYAEYIAENVDKNIKYAEYIAENTTYKIINNK